MPNIDTADTYPSRYYKYLETQRRVSKWVEKSGSTPNQSTSQLSRHGSKRKLTSESADALVHAYESASVYRRSSSKRHNVKNLPRRYSETRDDKTAIPPAFALVSSSLFVWALLPSILTLSAFVVILSFATLNDEVCMSSIVYFATGSNVQFRRLRNTTTGRLRLIQWRRYNSRVKLAHILRFISPPRNLCYIFAILFFSKHTYQLSLKFIRPSLL